MDRRGELGVVVFMAQLEQFIEVIDPQDRLHPPSDASEGARPSLTSVDR